MFAKMSTKNLIIAGGAVAIIGAVFAWQRKAKAAVQAQVQAQAQAANAASASGVSRETTVQGLGNTSVAPVAIGTTAATVSAIAPIVQTTVTTVAGVAGLALTLMSVKEKKMSLAAKAGG